MLKWMIMPLLGDSQELERPLEDKHPPQTLCVDPWRKHFHFGPADARQFRAQEKVGHVRVRLGVPAAIIVAAAVAIQAEREWAAATAAEPWSFRPTGCWL